MQARTFLILLIATIAGVAAAAAAVLTRPGDEVHANLGDPVVPGLIDRVNDVAKIRIESEEGGVLTFQRQAGADGKAAWVIVERDMYPAKAGELDSLALRVAQLTYLAPKTTNPELFSRLELGDPAAPGTQSTGVRLFDKDGVAMADLVVGTARSTIEGSTRGGAYFRLPGSNQTWVGRGDMTVDRLIFDWIDRRIFDIETERIRRVEITHPDGETVHVFKDQAGDSDFILADVPGERKIKSALTVNGVASTIGDYQVLDMIRRDKHQVDPARAVRIVYETFDGLKITALLEKQAARPGGDGDPEYWVDLRVEGGADSSEGRAEFAHLKERTEEWLYKLSDFRYDALAKRLDDLTDPAPGS